MSLQWKDEFTDQLCDAIVAITDRDEAYRFLEDIATFSEIKAFSQRLQVANLLLKGMSYPQKKKKKKTQVGHLATNLRFDLYLYVLSTSIKCR